MQKYLYVSLFAVAILCFSCGIKGPPLPPLDEETVQKQKAAEQSAAPEAPVKAPTKTKKAKK